MTYHSKHGAVQEAETVFIDAALLHVLEWTIDDYAAEFCKNNFDKIEIDKIKFGKTKFLKNYLPPINLHILEIGLGTGLNALMTFLEIQKQANRKMTINLNYTAFEAFPPSRETISALNYVDIFAENPNTSYFFDTIHQTDWETPTNIDPDRNAIIDANRLADIDFDIDIEIPSMLYCSIVFTKKMQEFQALNEENCYDIIYYDAFAPATQPELWTIEVFEKMYRALRPNGVLTTYCAKGEVKRNLCAAGFRVESLPGPIGKREMTRAVKDLL